MLLAKYTARNKMICSKAHHDKFLALMLHDKSGRTKI